MIESRMSTKARLHFHSDCEFFAGCERLMPLLWNSESVLETYSMTFSYRAYPRYEDELERFLPKCIKTFTLSGNTPKLRRRENSPFKYLDKIYRLRHKTFAVFMYYPRFMLDVYHVYRILQGVKPTILHLNNGGFPGARSVRAAAVAGRLVGCSKIIMVVNNITVPYASVLRILDYPIDAVVKRCTTKFVTGSTVGRIALISVLRINDSKVEQIPNAAARPVPKSSRDSVRQSQNVDQDKIVVGLVGLLEERKGHYFFLEALDTVLRANPELRSSVRVWFVGDGPLESRLQELVKQYGLSPTVAFLGYRQDHLDLVNAMDIIVLPSIRDEDSPLITLEAMALAKPVIVSRVAGLVEQVQDGYSGFLVKPGDADELGQRLNQLLTSAENRREFSKTAHKLYEEKFSPGGFIDRYMRLYAQL